MKSPSVTVLMSVYNGDRYLAESIESVLVQSCPVNEFIIVDDGSSDSTLDIIETYMRHDSRIALVRNSKNLGLAASLNRGAKVTAGKYIARFDADDVSVPNRISFQLDYMEAHSEIAVCGGKGWVIDSLGKECGEIVPRAFSSRDIFVSMFLQNQIIHPLAFIRREVFEAVGGYSEKLSCTQDYDLWFKIIQKGYSVHNLDEYLVKYRTHGGSISVSRAKKQEKIACRIISSYAKQILGLRIPLSVIASIRSSIQRSTNLMSEDIEIIRKYADALRNAFVQIDPGFNATIDEVINAYGWSQCLK